MNESMRTRPHHGHSEERSQGTCVHARLSDTGFILAEYVIAMAMLFIVATGAFGALMFAASTTQNTTLRTQALELANQCIEQARNMPYDAVGTVSGFPSGSIPDTQTVGNFTVNSDVQWAFDSITQTEACKTMTVVVAWDSGPGGSITLESNIAGKTSILNAGDVTIVVVDGDTAKPVANAVVRITGVTGTTAGKSTDASGSAMWGQVPSGRLAIFASAPGYAMNLSQVASATVVANQMNRWTISAAKSSSGIVTVTDQAGAVLPGALVTISGPSGTLTATSAANGTATFPDLLKGTYSATASLAGYATTSGTLGIIAGGSSYGTTIKLTKLATLKVVVKDDAGALVPGVSLSITPAGTTGPSVTDASGSAVFTAAGAGPYTVTATGAGYFVATAVSGSLAAGSANTLNVTIVRILPCTLNLTVIDQFSNVVPGASLSVSGPGSVTGPATSDAAGKATFTLGLTGVYAVQSTKTGYFPASVSTSSIPNGGNLAFTVTMSQITTGTLQVTYTTSLTGSQTKVVYIYNASRVAVSQMTFTKTVKTSSVVLTAGQYYGSTRSSWPGTSTVATAPYLNAGSTVSVNVSSAN